MGPAAIKFSKFIQCPEVKITPGKFGVNFRMINKTTQVVTGYLFIPEDIGYDVSVCLNWLENIKK